MNFYCNVLLDLRSCGDPGEPVNGRKSGDSYTVGSNVTFICDMGFVLRGALSIICNNKAEWSYPLPVCVRGIFSLHYIARKFLSTGPSTTVADPEFPIGGR